MAKIIVAKKIPAPCIGFISEIMSTSLSIFEIANVIPIESMSISLGATDQFINPSEIMIYTN
jgi:hypothetical protein